MDVADKSNGDAGVNHFGETGVVEGYCVEGSAPKKIVPQKSFGVRLNLLRAAQHCGAYYAEPVSNGISSWWVSIRSSRSGDSFRFLFAELEQAEAFRGMITKYGENTTVGGWKVKDHEFTRHSFSPTLHEAVDVTHCLRWEEDEQLNLFGSGIDADDVAVLAEALKVDSELEKINMNCCKVIKVHRDKDGYAGYLCVAVTWSGALVDGFKARLREAGGMVRTKADTLLKGMDSDAPFAHVALLASE